MAYLASVSYTGNGSTNQYKWNTNKTRIDTNEMQIKDTSKYKWKYK